jgi:hypothetical protein
MPEQPAANDPPVHSDVNYERGDGGIGFGAAIGISLVLLCTLAYGICLWMFDAFKAAAARNEPGLAPLASRERPKLPSDLSKIPLPRLQVHEGADMDEWRRVEDQRLVGYGWTDPQKGTVHIPIGEAMRLLADPEYARDKGIRVAPARGGRK